MAPAVTPPPAAGQTVAIKTLLLTDLVDSTKMVERIGDSRAAEVWARHDGLARELLGSHGGREIDKTDGFLFLFERPVDAIQYVLAYHRQIDALGQELGVPLAARAGIHLGEVILRKNSPEDIERGAKPLEVEGIAKPTAARVMSLAQGRQTLLTKSSFDMGRRAFVGSDETGIQWLLHGPYKFKGVDDPLEIGEVGLPGFAPLKPPPDSEKAKRAGTSDETLGWRPAQGLEIPLRPKWLLKEKLGEGAYGEVWLGSKGGVSRVFKFCYDKENHRALRHEVALLQLLRKELGDREDIGRILDWQLEEPPYFLESEYAMGGTLPEWAEANGGLDAIPMSTRLDIVAQVARSLADVHAIGILHKDVKPANILVRTDRDGRPRCRVIDFGVGGVIHRKVVADQDLGVTVTDSILIDQQTVERALSPGSSSGSEPSAYVAPELLEGKRPTIQSDVYSLGVLLFQLVTGSFRRVVAAGWERHVDDLLVQEDIARCIDGAPEHRFGSARELAEHLNTIEERRAERAALERARVEAEQARIDLEVQKKRRNLFLVVSAVGITFTTVVAWFAWQAHVQAQQAIAERQRAEELLNFMVIDLYEALRPLNRLDLLRQIAQESGAYYATIQEDDPSPETLRNRGRVMSNIGHVLREQGNLTPALASLERAHGIAVGLATSQPSEPELQIELARSFTDLGELHQDTGDLAAASEHFAKAIEILKKLSGDQARIGLAFAQTQLGSIQVLEGDATGARQSFQAAVDTSQDFAGSKTPRAQLVHALAIRSLGETKRGEAELASSLSDLQTARDILEALSRENPANAEFRRHLADTHDSLGFTHELNGDLTGQLESYRRALSARELLASQDPRNPTWSVDVAASLVNLGFTLLYSGDPEGALSELERALEIRTRLVGRDPKNASWKVALAEVHTAIGNIHYEQRRLAEAVRAFRRSTEILEPLLQGNDHPAWNLLLQHTKLATAEARFRLGEGRSAEPLLDEVIPALRGLYDKAPDNPDHQRALAMGLLAEGRHLESRSESLDEALTIIEPLASTNNDVQALNIKAQSLLLRGRKEAARPVVARLKELGWNEPDFLELAKRHGL